MINTLSLPMLGLLCLTPLSIAIGQVLFKMTSDKLVNTGAPFQSVLFNPIFILALAIYGGATLLWIYVLKSVPLIYAYSFMALTFVMVPILSIFFLGEQVNSRYIIGAALIILGLLVVQSS